MLDNGSAKCSFFPKKEINDVKFLVSGVENIDYLYCNAARSFDHLCGKEVKEYKNKLSKKGRPKLKK